MLKFNLSIPNNLCLSCDVCCRFPDADSPLAPLFLPHEIGPSIKPYLNTSCCVKLKRSIDIYTCPFFNAKNNKCTIYSKRPFDCRIYPFAIMFDKDHKKIVLGIDTKCPFAQDNKNEAFIKKWSDKLISLLEDKKHAKLIAQNPSFIGHFQGDVIPLSTLATLTKFIINNPEKNGFKKLSLKDKFTFDSFLKAKKNIHSSESFVNLYVWKDLNPVWWKKNNDAIELLLEIDAAYIDFKTMKKFPDYIYLTKDLAELEGKKYKHKRASCNYFEKHYEFRYVPYKNSMRTECFKLFSKWASERRKKFKDPYYCQLLKDSSIAHKIALENYKPLGLIGRAIKIKNKICGYTFGFELTKDTFCILLEATDMRYKGISEYIFREFCKEMLRYTYINTMDDSGLENLRLSKLSYHPISYSQQM